MPRKSNDLKDLLARYRQIKISVIGKKSGVTADAVLPRKHPDQPRVERRRSMLRARATRKDSRSSLLVMGWYGTASKRLRGCQ